MLAAVALPLLCCGLPALAVGGAFALAGGWLAVHGAWLAAGVLLLLAVLVAGRWQRRRRRLGALPSGGVATLDCCHDTRQGIDESIEAEARPATTSRSSGR